MNRQGDLVDFVITWVDGNDPEWRKEKEKWLEREDENAWKKWTTGDQRFRDWDLLRYWFRGVEQCAPWVNRVHFVTWGHLPEWLNTNHPKLSVVKHEDFIPSEYLPTFNSRAIEFNLHRIPNLSERFVYFNDDMFLLRLAKPDSFFKHGMPCDFVGLDLGRVDKNVAKAPPYNAMVINAHFSKNEVIRHHLLKWFNPKYGFHTNLKTLLLLPWPFISMLQADHLPTNYLKESFDVMWREEPDLLREACMSKFRDHSGVNHWVINDWQRMAGRFVPRRVYRNTMFRCGDSCSDDELFEVANLIASSGAPMICINDFCETEEGFDLWRYVVDEAFRYRFSEPSKYELF